jgi:hypothetical protein
MRRRAPSSPAAVTTGLTRRTFLAVGAAIGVGIGLTTSPPAAAVAPPGAPATAAAAERPHRTLLGVL